ncbi:MAG: HAMP domain-containing histidine kinase [Eubacterium sp.]|nr:HAMP domain-containing histidine kinase [Eubacterium sp.]
MNLWILVGTLAIIVIILLVRLHVGKKQLRSFTEQLHRIREDKQNRLITVDTFDKDYLNLANELEMYVEEESRLIEKSDKDRQSVKNMIAGISHDFRTPLTTAMGYMQMIQKDEGLSEENSQNLKKAFDKTKYLKELSDEFFALSLIESRKEEDKTELSFKSLLENVTLEQYDWIKSRDIEFTADITDDPCVLLATEVDMVRMISNLYSNAKKYLVSRMDVNLTKEDGRILFVMANDMPDGCQIDVSKVFEPFHREYVGDKGGNGLGLYIVKRIVESYGGTIKAGVEEEIFKCTIVL